MISSNTHALQLVNVIYEYLSSKKDINLSAFLKAWPLKPYKTRIISRQSLPVLSYLSGFIPEADKEIQEIVKLLKASADLFAWGQTYAAEDFGVGFLQRYGWTELIGLRGPIKSKEIACGFLMLGPKIVYPLHSHAAEEIYVPLNAWSLWIKEKDPWISRPGGIPIYHRSWLPHGMRAGSEPMLALYLWQGKNLTQKSHIN